jgi:hypothetical protein
LIFDTLSFGGNGGQAHYTQYGSITNGGIRAHGDAAICYRTILHVLLTKSWCHNSNAPCKPNLMPEPDALYQIQMRHPVEQTDNAG